LSHPIGSIRCEEDSVETSSPGLIGDQGACIWEAAIAHPAGLHVRVAVGNVVSESCGVLHVPVADLIDSFELERGSRGKRQRVCSRMAEREMRSRITDLLVQVQIVPLAREVKVAEHVSVGPALEILPADVFLPVV
jgi:hypothetical protein